jgi:hypothetical protein
MDIGALDPAAYDGRIEHLDCYRLDQVDLAGYQGLIIAGMVDREYLLRHRGRPGQHTGHPGGVQATR